MPPPQNPFWDFIQSMNNPNNNRRDPGHGVDHNTSPPFPGFPGFPFAAPPHGNPPHPHPPPPPAPGSGPSWDQAPPAWAYWFNNFNGPPRYDEQPFSHDAGVNANANANVPRDAEREGRAPREKENTEASSPDTMQQGEPFPDPAEVTPSESEDEDNDPRGGVPPGSFPTEGGRGGRWGRGHGGRGGHAHAHGRGRCGGRRGWRRGGGGPFEGPHPGPPFDFPGMMRGFMAHPFFRNLRDQAERYSQPATRDANANANAGNDDENTFSPPVDIFNTPDAFILHTALPGAKKDDVGVTWNPHTRSLRIAGVVHRPGDEAFLQTLTAVRERRVGVFEREVKLPPEGEAERRADREEADLDVDVDGFGITARMEEGVLIVTVPKVEKEWMEVRKVDIE
ncbi:hypothetical protein V8C35DRAFT_306779 [Trichoderma chlorosporum]